MRFGSDWSDTTGSELHLTGSQQKITASENGLGQLKETSMTSLKLRNQISPLPNGINGTFSKQLEGSEVENGDAIGLHTHDTSVTSPHETDGKDNEAFDANGKKM